MLDEHDTQDLEDQCDEDQRLDDAHAALEEDFYYKKQAAVATFYGNIIRKLTGYDR